MKDCLAENSRSTCPQQLNTDDHKCPVDNVEWSSSADWRTADVDDWLRRLYMCNFPSCTAELFHGDIGTPAQWAWIVLGRRHQASGVRRAIATLLNFRVLLTTQAAEFIARFNLSVVTFNDPANISVAIVNARSHKCVDECCCWLCVQGLSDTANLHEVKKQAALTTETCFYSLKAQIRWHGNSKESYIMTTGLDGVSAELDSWPCFLRMLLKMVGRRRSIDWYLWYNARVYRQQLTCLCSDIADTTAWRQCRHGNSHHAHRPSLRDQRCTQ